MAAERINTFCVRQGKQQSKVDECEDHKTDGLICFKKTVDGTTYHAAAPNTKLAKEYAMWLAASRHPGIKKLPLPANTFNLGTQVAIKAVNNILILLKAVKGQRIKVDYEWTQGKVPSTPLQHAQKQDEILAEAMTRQPTRPKLPLVSRKRKGDVRKDPDAKIVKFLSEVPPMTRNK